MIASHLTAVTNNNVAESANGAGEVYDLGRELETGAQRIRRLQREARMLAREQIETLARELTDLGQRAAEIAEGGEAYPVGARELASRMADDLPHRAQLLIALTNRAG